MRSALLLMLLAGCATPQKNEVVQVPVPVPCNVTLPDRPVWCVPKDDSRVEWLRCVLVDLPSWQQYARELEATLTACVP